MVSWDWANLNQIDLINQKITQSVITLSGFHYTKVLNNTKNVEHLKDSFLC
jgi:hypothetical protein